MRYEPFWKHYHLRLYFLLRIFRCLLPIRIPCIFGHKTSGGGARGRGRFSRALSACECFSGLINIKVWFMPSIILLRPSLTNSTPYFQTQPRRHSPTPIEHNPTEKRKKKFSGPRTSHGKCAERRRGRQSPLTRTYTSVRLISTNYCPTRRQTHVIT